MFTKKTTTVGTKSFHRLMVNVSTRLHVHRGGALLFEEMHGSKLKMKSSHFGDQEQET